MPEDVLLCGHLEIDLCAGDQTVLLDHRVDRLHPAVPEVYPVDGGMQEETSGTLNDCVTFLITFFVHTLDFELSFSILCC